jgi:Tol biopolymer transport system component
MRFANPSFSPDGRRIVFSETDSIWTMPISGGTAARITAGLNPCWSPDGEWLAFRMREGARNYLAKIRLGAMPQPVKLRETTAATPPAWSPDGRWLALAIPEGLAVISPDGKEQRLLLARKLNNYSPVVWSRNGKTLYMTELSTRGVHFESKLSEIDFASARERMIAVYPDLRLDTVQMNSNTPSIMPDGKGLTTPMFRYDSTIYMIEGLQPPRTRLERWLARTPLY